MTLAGRGCVVAVVPAAGRSSRFGAQKLLAEIDGRPLIDRTVASLFDGGVDRLVLVVRPGASLGAARMLQDARVTVVVNPDPDRGMLSSMQVGFAAALDLPERGDLIVLHPADMPFVRPATVRAVIEASTRLGTAVVAGTTGRRGHPLAFPASLVPALLSAGVTGSLKEALAAAAVEVTTVEVDDPGVLRDVDVPADVP